MTQPVPIHIIRQLDRLVATGHAAPSSAPPLDQLSRPLRDLRISVTDRCNFRCTYCMPKAQFDKHHRYLSHNDLLSFEEITRLAKPFVELGVGKIRLTGGEPLLRKGIEDLIAQLAALRTPAGQPLDLALTTNGSLLARKARALKDAGLNRITISLDGLDDAVFQRMNDVGFPVARVLDGISAAQAAGFSNIKVNMVVKRGVNEQEILPMARFFRGTGVTVRYIEFMDVGATNGWRMDDVVPSAEVVERLRRDMALTPLNPGVPGETAQRWGHTGPDGRHAPSLGEIGVISSVTQAFCHECSRARISTEGRLYLCLFGGQAHDLRGLIRRSEPLSDQALKQAITQVWTARTDRYSLLRTLHTDARQGGPVPAGVRPEMSYIGG
jgi:cyclic pyranopterin phosphate synthase